MKVILKSTNQLKEVPYGYAVNYLFPRGLAMKATEENLKVLDKELKDKSEKSKAIEEENSQLAQKLNGKKFIIKAKTPLSRGKTGKGDKLFGSITKKDIFSQFSDSIDRVEVLLNKPIKKLGNYNIELKIGKSRAKIELKVISKK